MIKYSLYQTFIYSTVYVSFRTASELFARIRARFRANIDLCFPNDRSKAVPLLQFVVCVSVVSYVTFVLSLFVPHLSFIWCFERAVLRERGISGYLQLYSFGLFGHFLILRSPFSVASERLCFMAVAFPCCIMLHHVIYEQHWPRLACSSLNLIWVFIILWCSRMVLKQILYWNRLRIIKLLLGLFDRCLFVFISPFFFFFFFFFFITKTRLFKKIENFTTKNWKFSDEKNSDIFFIFLLKHRLWVLVRTASEYPQSMILSRSKKNNVYPL